MRETLISLTSLFLAVLLMMLGNGLLGSLLGLKLAQAGASPLAAGVVMAGYYLGLVIGAFVCQGIVRRVGHIRAFAAFGAINVATVMLLALTTATPVWVALRIITGITMMGLYMVVESWFNERAERRVRGRVFSLYMAVSFAGLGGGQFLLAMNDIASLDLFLVAGMLFSLCLVPVALTRAVHPQPVEATRFDIRHLFQLAPYAVIACSCAGLVNGAFYALGPVYAYATLSGAAGTGAFMGVTIIGGLLLQWPVGLLSDRFDRRTIMALLSIAVAVLSLLLLLLESALFWQLVIALLWGGLAFTVYPVAVAYANDHIEPQDIMPAAGALLLSYGIGAAMGPLL
ncbi:MAG TPA: MFS transporter, partial [Gammaproteobacteria bacterium]|nr:MFS transporter [Gammaproteobacteria bacterium]